MSKTMDLTSKLRQKLVIDRLAETDWLAGTKSPLVVELDTTESCDLACPGCISEDIMATGNRFSNERLLELGKEFYDSGVKAVVLIGGGEPLAHPAVGDLIEFFGTHDIHVGITTNGTFIRKHLDVIAKYSSWTRVSMDAATNGMFQKLRPSKKGGSKFDFIVDNMRRLAEIKRGKLGFSFLIQTEADGPGIVSNINEIYQAGLLARDIGCDYFEVKPSYQFRDGIDHALMVHDQKQMDIARQEIERLEELETESFRVMKAINLEFSLTGRQEVQLKDYKKCPATELRTLVCPSGAFVCPYWRGKEQMKIGDATEMSFGEIWDGTTRQRVMEELDASRHCQFHCLRHKSNVETIEIKKQIDSNEAVQIVEEFDRFI
jgi:MoaA/NifB/PqqE/SkfB family radical SAM enzyme